MDSSSRPSSSHPRRHDLDGLVEEVGHEHLAADVHVHAEQLDAGGVLRPGHGARRVASGDAEAELRVDLAGLHELVGVRLDARGGPDQHLRHQPVVGVERG